MIIKVKKALYIIAGSLAFALALIGVVVRGIPTTPLLLLTLMCYSKGSERLATWFKSSFFYKKFLNEYVERKALTLKQKIFIQIFASIMIIISFIAIDILFVRIILALCFIAHNYVFIFKIKTYYPEKENIDE